MSSVNIMVPDMVERVTFGIVLGLTLSEVVLRRFNTFGPALLPLLPLVDLTYQLVQVCML